MISFDSINIFLQILTSSLNSVSHDISVSLSEFGIVFLTRESMLNNPESSSLAPFNVSESECPCLSLQ
jgi:hypothetical protein